MAGVIAGTVNEMLRGVLDACAVHRVARVLLKSKEVRAHLSHCVALNGCIFLGSIVVLKDALVPSLRRLLTIGDADQLLFFLPFFEGLFQVLWLLPAYAICIVINMLWFNDLSKSAFAFRAAEGAPKAAGASDSGGRDGAAAARANAAPAAKKGLSFSVGSELWRTFIFISFLAQISLVSLLPGIGTPVSFLMTCWMNAFYSFDSKWALLEWDLEKRLACFEHAWAYFAGFGVPHTLLTFFLPSLTSAAVWSLFFPVFVLGAMSAEHDGEAAAARSRAAGLFRLGIWRWTSLQCHALLDLLGYGAGVNFLGDGRKGPGAQQGAVSGERRGREVGGVSGAARGGGIGGVPAASGAGGGRAKGREAKGS